MLPAPGSHGEPGAVSRRRDGPARTSGEASRGSASGATVPVRRGNPPLEAQGTDIAPIGADDLGCCVGRWSASRGWWIQRATTVDRGAVDRRRQAGGGDFSSRIRRGGSYSPTSRRPSSSGCAGRVRRRSATGAAGDGRPVPAWRTSTRSATRFCWPATTGSGGHPSRALPDDADVVNLCAAAHVVELRRAPTTATTTVFRTERCGAAQAHHRRPHGKQDLHNSWRSTALQGDTNTSWCTRDQQASISPSRLPKCRGPVLTDTSARSATGGQRERNDFSAMKVLDRSLEDRVASGGLRLPTYAHLVPACVYSVDHHEHQVMIRCPW